MNAEPKGLAPRLCDPITLEIIQGAIQAAQAEMEALIERTAFSAFIREKKDFYTALFDEHGVTAVGSMVPIFGDIATPVFDHFPIRTMRPGDLYWYNDCYGSYGAVSHSDDRVLLMPVFAGDRLCAFVMSWAHFADIGGMRPGSISPDAVEIWQEGIIVPPTRLIDAGVVNEAALAIFHRNSRYPDQSRGDWAALMASVQLGAARVGEIGARFGADVLSDALAQLLDRTRRLVRRRLAETFDCGTHRFTDAIDSDGHGNGPFHLRFAITREKGADGEDRFIFDATETDDQAPGPVNLLMNGRSPAWRWAFSTSAAMRPRSATPGGPWPSTRCACARGASCACAGPRRSECGASR
jgi:N-methylhydantoinase B